MVDDFTLYGTFFLKKRKYIIQNKIQKPQRIISNHANEKSFSFFFFRSWMILRDVHFGFLFYIY